MYKYPDQVNWTSHFLFDGHIIQNYLWASLPSATKSIFPVIASFQNDRGYAYPSEQTIAILSGRTNKTIRNAVKGLSAIESVTLSHHVTPKGRRAKKFHIESSPPESLLSFPFFICLLEKGLWQHLRPSAHALYPVMRHFGFFDLQTYRRYNHGNEEGFTEELANRDYDYCIATREQLFAHAGISKQTLAPAFNSLEACELIKPLDKDPGGQTFLWKVFFKTGCWFPRELLNDKISKRYKNSLL